MLSKGTREYDTVYQGVQTAFLAGVARSNPDNFDRAFANVGPCLPGIVEAVGWAFHGDGAPMTPKVMYEAIACAADVLHVIHRATDPS